jgi:ABC-type transport system involved in multi-copper enzyme maturation permease subunit
MRDRSLAQTLALVFGLAFLGAGVLGFIPGITTNLGDIEFAGNESPSELLGIFQVSILHNIVHLLFGIAGIALARTLEGARTYLLGSGVIYVVLVIYGLLVSSGSDANFVPINNADDVLHLILAVGLLGAWFVTRGETAPDRTTTTTPSPTA